MQVNISTPKSSGDCTYNSFHVRQSQESGESSVPLPLPGLIVIY